MATMCKSKNLPYLCVLAGILAFASLNAGAQSLVPSAPPVWPQWGLNAQHTQLLSGIAGQPINNILADILYDFNVDAMKADPNNLGDLTVHYQVPLIDGNDVYIESKDGTYSNTTYSQQHWHQNKYTWQGNTLTRVWTFNTDWFAPGSSALFWEPVYHAVLANGVLYDPGQGGTIFKINKSTGAVIKRINPFGTTINANTFTASPLTADSSGNIYYNVIQVVDPANGFNLNDAIDSWLVKITPAGVI